jgi:putative ABC transport system ATP-binding protein
VLIVKQVCRSFREGDREHRVLDHAQAQFANAEVVAVVGRSGSGKSTLLNLISGIDRPDSGSVEVDGLDVTALPEPRLTLFRRKNIGFVYQFFNLVPTLDVEENVRLVLELNGVRGAEARERSFAVLREVGLEDRAHSAVDTLSGGEQQRVAIARALVHRPPILLADEPTGNLDDGQAERLMQLFKEMNRIGTTVIVATHNERLVERHPAPALHIANGRLVDGYERGRLDDDSDEPDR